jgi:hypothetical protein
MSTEPLAPPVVLLALGVGQASRLLVLTDRERMARSIATHARRAIRRLPLSTQRLLDDRGELCGLSR